MITVQLLRPEHTVIPTSWLDSGVYSWNPAMAVLGSQGAMDQSCSKVLICSPQRDVRLQSASTVRPLLFLPPGALAFSALQRDSIQHRAATGPFRNTQFYGPRTQEVWFVNAQFPVVGREREWQTGKL